MPASCTVTPGATLTDTSNVTAAVLNLMANPQVQVPDGAVQGPQLNVASVLNTLATVGLGGNYFLNPNFAAVKWSRGSTAVSCPVGTLTQRADNWWCNPAGAPVTYERVQNGPNHLSLHSAKITGASSVTTVDFGQDVLAHLASVLCSPIVVSVWIYNDTGASLTPTLRIDTVGTLNDFSAVTNRYSTASPTAGASGAWTRHVWVIDASAFANIHLGARIYVRLPSGSMNAGTKSVQFSQWKVELGTAVTGFVVPVEESVSTAAATVSSGGIVNFLDNPDFAPHRWLEPGIEKVATSDADTYNAEGWWLNEDGAGSAMRYYRSSSTPSVLSAASAEIKGGSGSGTVRFGQNRDAGVAAACRREMVFAIQIFNSTGATITPTLKIDTCNTTNDFANASTQISQALTPIPNGQWLRVSETFDGSAIANFANGFRIYIELSAGIMTTTGDIVRFAQAQLEAGNVASAWAPPAPTRGTYGQVTDARNLQGVANSGAKTATITADEVTVQDAAGRVRRLTNVSVSLDGANVGANGRDTGASFAQGWQYLWIIAGDAGVAGLYSLSRTDPVLPAGYTYRGLVGAALVAFGGNFAGNTVIRGKRSLVTAATAHNSTLTTAYQELDLTAIVPPTATTIFGSIGVAHATLDLSATFNCNDAGVDVLYPFQLENTGTAVGALYAQTSFVLPLTKPQAIDVKAESATPSYLIQINGWEVP